MRMIIFFDLPTITGIDRKEYSKFRRFLIREGFSMMQESVYSKLTLNNTSMELMRNKLKKSKPKKGLVQVLLITEKQFSQIDYIVGENLSNVLDSTDRLIII